MHLARRAAAYGLVRRMARNAEVIRQWNILRTVEAAKNGVSIDSLARQEKVTTRTIRRDLDALQQAGFPLYDDRADGRTRWKLNGQALKGLETGFSLSELCALYFSRTLLECLAGTPFQSDLGRAFAKFEAILAPGMRRFLDLLPGVLAAKVVPTKTRQDPEYRETIARLLEATLQQRKTSMRYHSFSSNRTKDYEIDPYRLVYAQGGLYLFAYVPEYRQMRTFAVERIGQLSLRKERFEPVHEVTREAFPDSLGVHQGNPERVEIEFSARVAPYIRERQWHTSQQTREKPDGSIVIELNVCNDWALRSWILSFGPFARVVSPLSLAEQILDEIDEARTLYVPRFEFAVSEEKS